MPAESISAQPTSLTPGSVGLLHPPGALSVPVHADVAGGLAFEYNLTGQNGQQIKNLVLNSAILEGIFTGADQQLGRSGRSPRSTPNDALPNRADHAYYRGDPSGENYLLGDYFFHTVPGPLASLPTGGGGADSRASLRPHGRRSRTALRRTLQASYRRTGRTRTPGPVHTAGWHRLRGDGIRQERGLPVASVINTAGSRAAFFLQRRRRLDRGHSLSDLTQNLAGVYTNTNPDAYPLSAYSYFIAQCVPSQAAAQNFACDSSGNVSMGTAQGAELAQFITFVACLGQRAWRLLGYSPIPANLVEDDFQAAGRLPGGTTPPAPNAQNCQTPISRERSNQWGTARQSSDRRTPEALTWARPQVRPQPPLPRAPQRRPMVPVAAVSWPRKASRAPGPPARRHRGVLRPSPRRSRKMHSPTPHWPMPVRIT